MKFGPIGARAAFLRGAGLAALGALLATAASAAPHRDPSGTWLTQDGKARIRVEKCGPQEKNLCGYAVWLKTPLNDEGKPRVDFRNPDPKKRARASLGHQLILGLKLNEDARYEGKIYNAEDGKFYDVTIWSEEPEELTVKGCLIAFLCQSQTWKKVSDTVPGQLAGPTNGPTPVREGPGGRTLPHRAQEPSRSASRWAHPMACCAAPTTRATASTPVPRVTG